METLGAAILVTVGIVVLAYSGISFTTPGKPVEFLGLRIKTTDNHFIPPVAGALALVRGIVLLVLKPRQAWAVGHPARRPGMSLAVSMQWEPATMTTEIRCTQSRP